MIDINRINELAKKSKTVGLSEEEKQEQARLRQEYIDGFKRNLRAQLDNCYVLDEQGNKVALTEEEETRWRSYLDGRQRKRVAPSPQGTQAQPASPQPQEDLPF